MERIASINQTAFDAYREDLQGFYPEYPDPLPGSRLKLDDDVLWLGVFAMRVLWGHDHPAWFNGFCPELGDICLNVEGVHIQDRAPADPQDLPAMPIYPEEPQQLMRAAAATAEAPDDGAKPRKHELRDEQRALRSVLAQIPIKQRKAALQLVAQRRPELVQHEKG